jgi:hypothetical protein
MRPENLISMGTHGFPNRSGKAPVTSRTCVATVGIRAAAGGIVCKAGAGRIGNVVDHTSADAFQRNKCVRIAGNFGQRNSFRPRTYGSATFTEKLRGKAHLFSS